MKKEKVLVNKKELARLLDYLEEDEYRHYMSYESPRPADHIYITIKNLKKKANGREISGKYGAIPQGGTL